MNKTRIKIYLALLLPIITLLAGEFCFDGKYSMYALFVSILFMALSAIWIKKIAGKLKEQNHNDPPFIAGYKEFYYSKNLSVTLLVMYILMSGCFSFACILHGGWLYHLFMGLAAGGCLFFLWYILKKWLLPAYRDEPYFTIDDKSIDLKNSYTPISWDEIDSIVQRGSVIGIKLKNLDEFLNKQPFIRKAIGIKFYRMLHGFHFGISFELIRGNEDILKTIMDYFNHFK